MEPANLILEALTSGAVVAAKPTASQAVKDLYNALKSYIKGKFSNNLNAEMVLSEYEKKPELYKEPLKDKLNEAAVDKDREIIEIAQKLMELVDPESAEKYEKFEIKGDGNIGINGNTNSVTIGNMSVDKQSSELQ